MLSYSRQIGFQHLNTKFLVWIQAFYWQERRLHKERTSIKKHSTHCKFTKCVCTVLENSETIRTVLDKPGQFPAWLRILSELNAIKKSKFDEIEHFSLSLASINFPK